MILINSSLVLTCGLSRANTKINFSTVTPLHIEDNNDLPSEQDNHSTNVSSSHSYPNSEADQKVPELVQSRAMGKWDSSTVPDTNSNSDQNSYDKLSATYHKNIHDTLKAMAENDINKLPGLIESQSGKTIPDLDVEHITELASSIHKMPLQEGQEYYVSLHGIIVEGYASVSESIKVSKEQEIIALRHAAASPNGISGNLEEEIQKVQDKYLTVEQGNDQNLSELKGELRYAVQGIPGFNALGMDETNLDAVEMYKYDLRNRENTPKEASESNNQVSEPNNQSNNSSSSKNFAQDSSDISQTEFSS